MSDDPSVGCRGHCGTVMADPNAARQAGWDYLFVTGGWRCPSCDRALRAASTIVGTEGETADRLDPKSRGALPKATAETITPPTVKG